MSTRDRIAGALLLALGVAAGGTGVATASELGGHLIPALGTTPGELPRPVTSPDGTGLPAGAGSVADGRPIYESQCASCHGFDGKLQINALVGGIGSLGTEAPMKTVGSFWPHATTLWDYIHVAMPYGAQNSLSVDQTYAVTAYVLHLNGILEADAALDRDALLEVEMPNADGFDERWR